MTTVEILTVVAILAGPVVAVQLEKHLERSREHARQKRWIFHTLMATRAARLTAEHVQALNSIDVVFYDTKAVRDKWKEYLDALGDDENLSDAQREARYERRSRLFTDLLDLMGRSLKFDFDWGQYFLSVDTPPSEHPCSTPTPCRPHASRPIRSL